MDPDLEEQQEIIRTIERSNMIFTRNCGVETDSDTDESDVDESDADETDHPKHAIQALFDYMNNDVIDLCMSRNNDIEYEELDKTKIDIYFRSCCVCQLSMDVKLEKGKKYKHKGSLNLFTLDKNTDEETTLFDIDQKKRILYMKYPTKRTYELTDYKINQNHIQEKIELELEFNYFQYS
tara:strand:- start:17627 stop:18166 length:540 start_codon:yes stop_codon:yes gene_type:complete